jgi:hypothetical protein
MDQTNVCKYARPGFTCNLVESTVFGCLHAIASVACLYALYHEHKRQKSSLSIRPGSIDFSILFWSFEALWLIYHSVIMLTYFPYTREVLYIVVTCIDQVLFLLPISLLILILTERSPQMQHQPRRNSRLFARFLFVIMIAVILFLGVAASFVYVDEPGENGDIMFLWQGCMTAVVAVFVILPAHKAIRDATDPVLLPEDVSCVHRSRILIWAFGINFLVSALYNILAFLGWNPLQTALHGQVVKEDRIRADARLAYALGGIVLQDLPSVWAVLGVFWLRQRDTDRIVTGHETQDSVEIGGR